MIRGAAVALLFCVLPGGVVGGSPSDAGAELKQQALVELTRGKLREGSALLRQALEQQQGATRAETLLLLAQAEINLGNYRSALTAARQALEIHESSGDESGLAQAHSKVAAAHDELAEYERSQHHFHRALELTRSLGDRRREAEVLSGLGTSYRFLGDLTASLRSYEQARSVYRQLGDRGAEGFTQRNIGVVLEDLERPAGAERAYREALELAGGWEWARADLLFHLGSLAMRRDGADSAVSLLEESLELALRSQNAWVRARASLALAELRTAQGRLPQALQLARDGVETFRAMGAQDLEWQARYVLGRVHRAGGRPEEAKRELLAATELLESVRSSIGLPTRRERHAPRGRQVYEALVDLLAQDGELGDTERVAATFDMVERTRARSFVELLSESRLEPDTTTSGSRDEEKQLRAKVSMLRTLLGRYGHSVADREALETELFEAERRHDVLSAELRRNDPRYDAWIRPRPVTAAELSQVIGPGADLLAYYLGDEASLGWHAGRDGLVSFPLPRRDVVENQVTLLRSLLLHGNDPAVLDRVAGRLHDLLVGPVAGRLEPGRPLVVVPDGKLFYLPFEVLKKPVRRDDDGARREWLVRRHAISYVPSPAVLRELSNRTRPPGRDIELIVFSDPRVGGPEPRLPGAAGEAQRITGTLRRDRVLVRSGAAATESAFRRLAARPSNVIHLATHGVLDGRHVERSGLTFAAEAAKADDGFLNLADILSLELDTDLVVLSACETGHGELLRGEGIVGVSRGFIFAGARAVVASLWKVDDRATGELMVAFYRHLQRGRTASEALRAAKSEWIDAAGGDAADPFPWSAFVLIGDADVRVPLSSRRNPGVWFVALGSGMLVLSALVLLAARRRVRPEAVRAR